MKVLLVFPSSTIYGEDPTVPGATPPLGLAYIASYVESHGYQVKILDALSLGIDNLVREEGKTRVGLSEREIFDYISDYKPDIVGISAMYTAYSRDAYDVARIAKEVNSETLVVFGGAHACLNPEMVLRDENVNLVVVGEGEVTFLEIMKTLEEGGDLSKILGTVVKIENDIKRNKPRPFIADLDILPFPARHLLSMEVYFKKMHTRYFMRPPHTSMITSRGCLGNCAFCSIHSIWRHRWRGRSAKNIVDEMEFLKKEYEIGEIGFLDDNMATDKKRMIEICDEIIKRKLNIKWTTPNGIGYWRLDKELLQKMKRSGCYRITFGIESGNPATRKFIGKVYPLKQATEMVKYANRIGMWTISTFIIGFPYEDRDSIQDTIDYAIDSDIDFALFYLLTPFPGTRVHDIFKKEGLLDLDYILDPKKNLSHSEMATVGKALAQYGCQTKYFSQKELQELLTLAYSKFWARRFRRFLNPFRTLRKIRSLEDFFYTLRLAKVGVSLILSRMKRKKFTVQMVYKDYDKCQSKPSH